MLVNYSDVTNEYPQANGSAGVYMALVLVSFRRTSW